MPSINENPQQFPTEGYCVFRGALTAEEVKLARRNLDALIATMPKTTTVYKDGKETTTESRPEYLTEPHVKPAGESWLELARRP